jgi:hypothetical protein
MRCIQPSAFQESLNERQSLRNQHHDPAARRRCRISQGVHVYLKERDVPHIWNVDDEGHTPKTWASNLYHFAQRIFR